MLLGSTSIKAVRRTLMKLSPDLVNPAIPSAVLGQTKLLPNQLIPSLAFDNKIATDKIENMMTNRLKNKARYFHFQITVLKKYNILARIIPKIEIFSFHLLSL